ncbi:HTH_38 domain-containing protein [Trichonephila clavipes]|nr:HTH_38 domain-containing protein [Trichonephila clavipes]
MTLIDDIVRMPLRRNRRQYEQLTDFDRGRIIGLREAGWSNRRGGRHLGRSDMVVARCWQQWITEGSVPSRRVRTSGTQMIARIVQSKMATSAPTTSLASIQRHLPPSRHPVPSRETLEYRRHGSQGCQNTQAPTARQAKDTNGGMCMDCSSEPVTPAHILECLGLTKQDLADIPLLVLDLLKVYAVMALI